MAIIHEVVLVIAACIDLDLVNAMTTVDTIVEGILATILPQGLVVITGAIILLLPHHHIVAIRLVIIPLTIDNLIIKIATIAHHHLPTHHIV